MQKVKLPSALRAFYSYYVSNVEGQPYTMYAADDCMMEEVTLPSYWYDERGHNTQVNHGRIVSVNPDQAPVGTGYMCNTEGPICTVERYLLKNGISKVTFRKAYVIVRDEKHILCVATGQYSHGINANYYVSQYELVAWKLDRWLNSLGWRYVFRFQSGGKTNIPCKTNYNVSILNPYDMVNQACSIEPVFTSSQYLRANAPWVQWTYTKVPGLYHNLWSFQEPLWLVERVCARPEVVSKAMSQAFKSAFDQFPKVADNNIANLLDVAKLVVDMMSGNVSNLSDLLSGRGVKSVSKKLANLWMAYRYSYSTTKSDVIQAINARMKNPILYMKPSHFNGEAEIPFSPYPDRAMTGCKVRVGFDVRQQVTDMVRAIKHGLYSGGLEVSWYTLYDLVPFSFVVDWFTGWGDQLAAKCAGEHYSDYIFSDVCWSLSYEYDENQCHAKAYSRWYDGHIPLPDGSMPAGSDATWLKRAGDTACLVINKW